MQPIELRSRVSFPINDAFKYAFRRHNMNYVPMLPPTVDKYRAEDAVIRHVVDLMCDGDEGLADVMFSLMSDEGLGHFCVIVAEAVTSQMRTGLNPDALVSWTTPATASSESQDRSDA